MPVRPPDPTAITSVAESYGLGLSKADVASFGPLVRGALRSWDSVEQLHDQALAEIPRRTWTRPEPADNPLGAWYVTCSVNESREGPLAGRTVAVKDNTAVAGVPMMVGSAIMEGFVPRRDATIVSRILDAGATITGKAVCEDLCSSGGSHTSRTGPVRNPWDRTRSCGGSSSGSAALVASGAVDFATGADQAGSIRVPASFSGIVGHKPTYGLVPYTGAFPVDHTIDHLGPMTRTVTDAAVLLGVMAGSDGHDPRQPADLAVDDYLGALARPADGLRIGVVGEGFGHPDSDPAVDDAVRAAVEILCDAGLTAEDISVPWHLHGKALWTVINVEGSTAQMVGGNGYGLSQHGLYDPELMEFYGTRWRQDGGQFSETVKFMLLAGRYVLDRYHGKHYAMARNLASTLRAAYDEALDRYDVLVMPTTPMRASVIPAADAPREEVIARVMEAVTNTCPLDVSGHPACSVPAGLVNGLPAGMMIIGKPFDDATVLRVAHTFEQAVGGFPANVPAGSVVGGRGSAGFGSCR